MTDEMFFGLACLLIPGYFTVKWAVLAALRDAKREGIFK